MRLQGLLFAAAILLAGGCSTASHSGDKKKSFTDKVSDSIRSTLTSTYHDPEADAKLAKGESLFKAEEYEEAEAIFAELADNTYNAALVLEKSRFMEAESVRKQGRLPRAAETYNRLLKDFPGSVHTEKAAVQMYSIADGWLKDTLQEFEDKQAGKYWIQRVRLPDPTDKSRPRMDQEGVLLVTLDNISTYAPNSSVADKAMFWCGYIHYMRGNYADADHFFSMLSSGYKDSPLRQDAAKYAVIAKNKSTGGPAYDGQKSAEALQLVHNLEATDPVYTQNKDKAAWLQRQKMSIRVSQAEKDFETAEFYRRTDHPGSAYFYYELVKRRYPGTKYSDLSISRIEEMEKIRKQREADKASGKQSTIEILQEKWDSLTGQDKPAKDPIPGKEPRTGPKDAPPRNLPPGIDSAR